MHANPNIYGETDVLGERGWGEGGGGGGLPSNGSTRQGRKLFVQETTNEIPRSHPQTEINTNVVLQFFKA